MLRVNDWVPTGQFGAPNNSFVIPSRFGPDGALYMARWSFGCCRNQLGAGNETQLVKIEFDVQDECLEDTQAPNVDHNVAGRAHPSEPNTYLDEATLTFAAGDVGCAGVERVEYRVNSDDEEDWQTYSAPVEFDQPGTYDVDYRATDRNDNVSAVKQAAFTVVHLEDSQAPAVTGTLSGSQNPAGHYVSPATLAIEATDALSPIVSIEYRVNQVQDWTKVDFDGESLTEELQEEFEDTGFHFVEFRATDEAGNTSAIQDATFSVVGACVYERSDEFDGTALDDRWLRHVRNGGTPTTGAMAPTLATGQLTMPSHDFEIDAANATTSVGPINFIGQDLAALGGEWQVETQFTVQHTGGWQGLGLMLWQADNNFVRSTITHSLSGGNIYVEQSKDNPTSTEGQRVQSSGNTTILPAKGSVTIRMRYARAAGSDAVTSQYRILAPENAATDDWVNFPGIAGGLDLNPTGGSRRDAAGSRIGLYAGGNFPGSTGANPYPGTPATMVVDYFRVTPDVQVSCPDDDVKPPVTTATLDPPGAAADRPVTVTLSASDGEDENASGVEVTEYSVDGGAWQQGTELTVSDEGAHSVRYRSRDEAGNLEVAQAVEFTIAFARDIFAQGTTWNPDQLTVPFGETVTWNFDEPAAAFAHDVWLTPPGGAAFQVTNGPVAPGGPPVSYTFRKAGSWSFLCSLHPGMAGTIGVGNPPPPPGTGPGPKPSPQPGPGPLPTPQPTPAKLNKLPRTTLGTFLRKGLRLVSRCETGQRGTVRITMTRGQARKIGLRRATTLATKRVRCGANDRMVVRLKPSAKLKRKLRTARRSVVMTVRVRMGSGSSATSDSRRLVLRAPKRR